MHGAFLGVLDTMAGRSALFPTPRLTDWHVLYFLRCFFSTFWAVFEGGEKRSEKELFCNNTILQVE
jgi:hypothetical protein